MDLFPYKNFELGSYSVIEDFTTINNGVGDVLIGSRSFIGVSNVIIGPVEIADHVIEVPEVDEIISPLVTIVPLQLLAYHIAIMRGCNVDQPRNLAKSVTVE